MTNELIHSISIHSQCIRYLDYIAKWGFLPSLLVYFCWFNVKVTSIFVPIFWARKFMNRQNLKLGKSTNTHKLYSNTETLEMW